MAQTPTGPPRRISLLGHLAACLWWLIFLGGVGAGAAAGVILALWLALPPLPGLLLIVACWLAGNAAGWTVATRTTACLVRRCKKQPKRIHTPLSGMPAQSYGGFVRIGGIGWILAMGPACP